MKSFLTNRKHTDSFRIARLLLAITPLWVMLAVANTSAHAQTSGTPLPSDWTQFHRDNMQRWNPYETVLSIGNVGSLQLKWSYANGTLDSFANSSPAVVNGIVYFGSNDGNVYALNASTGAKVWSYTTGGGIVSSPAVANGAVFVGSGDGNVYALSRSFPACATHYNDGLSGRSAHLCLPCVRLGACQC